MNTYNREPIRWTRLMLAFVAVVLLVKARSYAAREDMHAAQAIISEEQKESMAIGLKEKQDRDNKAAMYFYNKQARGE